MDEQTTLAICNEIDNAIVDLCALDSNINNLYAGYLRTGIHTVVVLLSATASVYDGRFRPVNFSNEVDLLNHQNIVNRIFISLIHTGLEAAIDKLISQKKHSIDSSMKNELNQLIDKVLCECKSNSSSLIKLRNKANKLKPTFNDKISIVLKSFDKKQKKMWLNYFSALSIIRHKCSHSDTTLSSTEIRDIKKSPFSVFLTVHNELNMHVGRYKEIVDHLLKFIDQVLRTPTQINNV